MADPDIPESKLDVVAEPNSITDDLAVGYPIEGGMLLFDGDGDPVAHLDTDDIDALEAEIEEWKAESPQA